MFILVRPASSAVRGGADDKRSQGRPRTRARLSDTFRGPQGIEKERSQQS